MTTRSEVIILAPEAISTPEAGPWLVVLRRLSRHRLAMLSFLITGAIFTISLFAQRVAPFKPNALAVGDYFLPPGAVEAETGRVHYLGTDHIGRDYFSRLVYAGRISLTVAVTSTLLTLAIGVATGAYAGFYGGWVDSLLMRAVEFLATIPALPLLLIISSMLLRNEDTIPIPNGVLEGMGKLMLLSPRDARQAVLIIIVLAGLGWLNDARLMRGAILSLRELAFVEAARSLGVSDLQIILRHMIPNAMAPIIVNASLNLSGFIVAEAALSFLGFGIQDPIPTWGNMLAATQQFMFDRPWLPLVPGLPIVLCSLAFNYIGDGLRDALDPRLKL
ncbi:MAG TPA: ABC transporter permease [Anaerolineales bacterium]|nr:ABC transporter permease [Anaerolineales bacterium]